MANPFIESLIQQKDQFRQYSPKSDNPFLESIRENIPVPLTEYEKYQKEHPVITALGKVQEFGKIVLKGAKNVVTHPIETIGGIGVGATEFVLGAGAVEAELASKLARLTDKRRLSKIAVNALEKRAPGLIPSPVVRGISEMAPSKTADAFGNIADYLQRNKKAIDKIFSVNMEARDSVQAGEVGKFIGEQIPYLLAAEATAGVVSPLTAGALGAYGKLTLGQASTIGKIISATSNTVGTAAINQLVIDKEATGSDRAKQALNDVLIIGAFEGLGFGGKALQNQLWTKKARSFVSFRRRQIS